MGTANDRLDPMTSEPLNATDNTITQLGADVLSKSRLTAASLRSVRRRPTVHNRD